MLLSGCGSDSDEAATGAFHEGSEPSLADDPLMACYGRVGFKERQDCVPGVGTMSARDLKVKLPEYAKVMIGKMDRGPDEVPVATLNVDDRWLRAFLVPYRISSHGMTPESRGTRIEVVNLADRSTVTSIDLPNTQMNAILPDTKNGLFVAALTDFDLLFEGGFRNKGPKIDATMAAVDPLAGKALWQKNDLLTSNPDAVIDRGVLPAYGVPDRECDGYTKARTVQVLDTRTGEAKWSKHVTELRGPKNGDQCTVDIVYADPGLPFIPVTRKGDLAVVGVRDDYNLTTNLDVDTGEVFAPLPSEVIELPSKSMPGRFFADPRSPLTLIEVAHEGQVGRTGGETGWLVVDRNAGTIVNRIPGTTLSEVKAGIVGLFDSQVYLKNSTIFTIDGRTNAEGGTVSALPVRVVNGWTLHDDGTFTKD